MEEAEGMASAQRLGLELLRKRTQRGEGASQQPHTQGQCEPRCLVSQGTHMQFIVRLRRNVMEASVLATNCRSLCADQFSNLARSFQPSSKTRAFLSPLLVLCHHRPVGLLLVATKPGPTTKKSVVDKEEVEEAASK